MGKASLTEATRIGDAAQSVATVLGNRGNAKPDVELLLADGTIERVSVKKAGKLPHGQAHLTTVDRFIDAWPKVTLTELPSPAERTLRLFAGAPGEEEIRSWAGLGADVALAEVEERHNKLNAGSIAAHFPGEWAGFVDWTKESAADLADLCLFKGYAADDEHWATGLWLQAEQRLVSREELLAAVNGMGTPTPPPAKTIGLPWGYLQTHQPRRARAPHPPGPNQLQFHWNEDDILSLLS